MSFSQISPRSTKISHVYPDLLFPPKSPHFSQISSKPSLMFQIILTFLKTVKQKKKICFLKLLTNFLTVETFPQISNNPEF